MLHLNSSVFPSLIDIRYKCILQHGVLQRHLTPHPKDSKRQMQSEVVQRHRQMAAAAKQQQAAAAAAAAAAEEAATAASPLLLSGFYLCTCL